MNRSEFLKSFGLSASGLFLPKDLLKDKPIKIYDNYIKGIQHYQYANLMKTIKEGDSLILEREPENKYDSFAIGIYFQDQKLGYIAAFENVALANMLDQGVELVAFVSKHQPDGDRFYALAIEIYANLIVQGNAAIIESLAKRSDDAIDIYRAGINPVIQT